MNKPKQTHTAGPWRIAGNTDQPTIRSCEAAPVTIASMAMQFPNLVSYETVLANAQLIAAAPALLEALQTLLDMRKKSGMPVAGVPAWEAAQSAIKQARGEV